MKPSQAHFHQLRRIQHTDVISECFIVQQIPKKCAEDELIELSNFMDSELAILIHTDRWVYKNPT